MQRWEYRVVDHREEAGRSLGDLENELAHLGREDWELVDVAPSNMYFFRLFFKRPKP